MEFSEMCIIFSVWLALIMTASSSPSVVQDTVHLPPLDFEYDLKSVNIMNDVNNAAKESATNITGLVVFTIVQEAPNVHSKDKIKRIKYLVAIYAKKSDEVQQKVPSLPKGKVMNGESALQAAIRNTVEKTGLKSDDFDVYSHLMTKMRLESYRSQKLNEQFKSDYYVKTFKNMEFYLAEKSKSTKAVESKQKHDKYIWVDLATVKGHCKYQELKDMMNEFDKIIQEKVKYGLGAAKFIKKASGDLDMIKKNVIEAELISQQNKNHDWITDCIGDHREPYLLADYSKEGVKTEVINIKCKRNFKTVTVNLENTIKNLNDLIREYNENEQLTSKPKEVFNQAKKDFLALLDHINSGAGTDDEKLLRKKYVRQLCLDTYRNKVQMEAIKVQEGKTRSRSME